MINQVSSEDASPVQVVSVDELVATLNGIVMPEATRKKITTWVKDESRVESFHGDQIKRVIQDVFNLEEEGEPPANEEEAVELANRLLTQAVKFHLGEIFNAAQFKVGEAWRTIDKVFSDTKDPFEALEWVVGEWIDILKNAVEEEGLRVDKSKVHDLLLKCVKSLTGLAELELSFSERMDIRILGEDFLKMVRS